MTRDQPTYHDKVRSVFLAAVMLLSMVAMSAAIAAPAAAANVEEGSLTLEPTAVQNGQEFVASGNVINADDPGDVILEVDGTEVTRTTDQVSENGAVELSAVANTAGDFDLGENDITLSAGPNPASATGTLIVSDDAGEAKLTGNVRTGAGAPIDNVEEVNITLTASTPDGDVVTVVEDVPLGNFSDGDLAASNDAITTSGFNEAGQDSYTVGLPTFGGETTYDVEATLPGFDAFDGTQNVTPGNTSTQDIRLDSNLQPATFGVASFNQTSGEVITNGSALLANGELDNNATFIAYAQSQIGTEFSDAPTATLSQTDEADVFDAGEGIFEVVNETTGERTNASSVSVQLDESLDAAAVENAYPDESTFEDTLVDPEGSVSYATFNITADNVTRSLLENTDGDVGTIDSQYLENFIINGTINTDGDLSVDVGGDDDNIEEFASNDSRSVGYDAETGNLTNDADALYFAEGEKSVTGDVRVSGSNDNEPGVDVWAIYDAAPDQTLDTVRDLVNADGEAFLTDTSGPDGYEITGLAGDDTDINLYATYDGFDSVQVDASDTGIESNVAAAADITTPTDTERTVTHDLVLQPENQEYLLDVTAEDVAGSGDLVKQARVPAGDDATVSVDVTSRAFGDDESDFTSAPDGTEVELSIINSTSDNNSEVAVDELALADDTPVTQNGTASTTLSTPGNESVTVNVSATVTNTDGVEFTTDEGTGAFADDGERSDATLNDEEVVNNHTDQAQVEVFETGRITGQVVDQNQQGVPGANVTLSVENETGDYVGPAETDILPDEFEVSKTTGSEGFYEYSDLPTGESYRVAATFTNATDEFDGFNEEDARNIGPGTNGGVDIVLGGLDVEDQPTNNNTDDGLARFDTNEDGVINRGEVIDAIIAYNDDEQIGGADVERSDVIDAIVAYNNEATV